jgi:DNA-binding Lrp family transcriptional regulator
MRVMAFVLIYTKVGSEKETAEAIREIPEVKAAYDVYGLYDVIAQIEVETQDELQQILGQRIRRMEGVRSTITMLVKS